MIRNSWAMRTGGVTLSLAFALSTISPAFGSEVKLTKGTDVKLAFDSSLNSSTAKPGDHVQLHVDEPVTADGKTVIAEGAKVRGTVTKVKKRGHFGVNADIQLLLDPVTSVTGKKVPLGFKSKSGDLSRPGTAAGASVGTAAVLGPVGLVAGYFVVGKKVTVKPGDKLTANTDRDVMLNVP